MKGNEKVIEALNAGLTIELTAINQYFIQSRMCKDWGFHKLATHHYQESIEEMQTADVLLLLQGGIFENQIPGKVYEYIRLGKPILALTSPGSATELLLRDLPHALTVDIENPADIGIALDALETLSVGPDFDVSRYSRYERTRELAALLDTMAGQGR